MKRVMIIAGETSGDHHAAYLIKQTHSLMSDIQFYGMGGNAMQHAGADIVIDYKELSVVGITEVIRHLPDFYKTYKYLRNLIKINKPDLLILVDFPDFNLRIAKIAKHLGVQVLYYISPQVWAWRKQRINIIRRCVNQMAVILPFEKDFYRSADITVNYVGNPLVSQVKPTLSLTQSYAAFDILADKKIIGLLPGSRDGELRALLPILLKSAELIQQRYPDCQFVLPLAPSFSENDVTPYFNSCKLPIKIIKNELYNVLQICDVVLTASGTVTLEVALMETPLIIIYKLSFISALIAWALVDFTTIGLCNLIAGEHVAKELVQYDATPDKIAAEAFKILENDAYNSQIRYKLKQIKQRLTDDENIVPIGEIVTKMLRT